MSADYFARIEAMRARERTLCTCGHKRESHGVGDRLPCETGSRIGLGPCGYNAACTCAAFTETTEHTQGVLL